MLLFFYCYRVLSFEKIDNMVLQSNYITYIRGIAMELESFNIIGISTRTTNENGQSHHDLFNLWQKLSDDNIIAKIPNQIENAIYCVYTDYEGDYTKPYTAILGCKVSSLDEIPEGLVGRVIPGGFFKTFIAKGDINKGAVVNKWVEIWESGLVRSYIADYEVYGEGAQNPSDVKVDIFVGIKANS